MSDFFGEVSSFKFYCKTSYINTWIDIDRLLTNIFSIHRSHNSVTFALRIRENITNDKLYRKDKCSDRNNENVSANERDKIEASASTTAVVSIVGRVWDFGFTN